MKKYSVNSITTLAFCCAMVDFLTFSNQGFLFPRDRIFHTVISSAISFFIVYIFQYVNIKNGYIKIIAVVFSVWRMCSLYLEFIDYFSKFHGSNKVSITILTIFLIVTICKFMDNKNYEIYVFFIIINVLLTVLMIILSVPEINTMNLYCNKTDFNFEYNKLPIFWEIIAIPMFFNNKSERISSSKKYILVSTCIIIATTILQGLCVQGNMLYSVSPLQSLMQVFTTDTVRRFDYIITMFQTFNYFGAIILYTWLLNVAYKEIKGKTDEKN